MTRSPPPAPYSATVHTQMAAIDAQSWDRCAGADNPFVRHGFLSALEDSGSVCPETGWLPQHLTVADSQGQIVAAAPLYLKGHSYGEYVFDWSWAEAYERAGGQYYPKLQGCVPFTPVTGPRLLCAPDAPPTARSAVLAAMLELAERHQVSSLHLTFPTATEAQFLEDAGLELRIGMQYHWHNHGYADFDQFLDTLTARKRKAIRRERRHVAAAGVRFHHLRGADLQTEHWDRFYAFYRQTSDRKWGPSYLTRAFFDRLQAELADQVLLILAERDAEVIAGALNLIGSTTLFGRNWGCAAEIRFLHFETCYYQAIDAAITHGLARVEAGAQGEHKIQRGYLPQTTYSAHWIADPGLRRAVSDFLAVERPAIEDDIAALRHHSPYRHPPTER